jgi:hypothetical protein
VNYWVRETKNRTIKVYFWKSWVSYCSNQPITLSGLQYSFREVNPDEYVFEVCSQSQTYSNTTFDFTELNRYLISQKLVSVWDARREVNVSIQVSGAGELTFVQRAYYNERKQYIFPQNRSIGGYFMVNEPFYTIWRSLDFINISLPVNGSTSGIISEAYFTIPNVLYPLRVLFKFI